MVCHIRCIAHIVRSLPVITSDVDANRVSRAQTRLAEIDKYKWEGICQPKKRHGLKTSSATERVPRDPLRSDCSNVVEHLQSGGKPSIRPRLIFKVRAVDGEPSIAREWGGAIELLHNATLVHDDYQDGDTHRRGQPTVWMKYGGPQAINAGDYLWSTAFHAIASREQEDGKTLGLVRSFSDMAMEVVQGQALELSPLEDGVALRERYIDIIRGKTSGSFRTPACGALHLAGIPKPDMDTLSHHFEELGLLFQLQDDLWTSTGIKDEVR